MINKPKAIGKFTYLDGRILDVLTIENHEGEDCYILDEPSYLEGCGEMSVTFAYSNDGEYKDGI